MQFGHFFC